jgi:programmed cell death protein 5
MGEEIEELKRKRLLELQQRAQEEREGEERRAQLEAQKRILLMEILTPEARERLGNIKVARPDFGEQVETLLIQLAQSGQLQEKIGDRQLKAILYRLSAKKKDITIRRI